MTSPAPPTLSALPTGREYFRRLSARSAVSSLASTALIALYLVALLRLSPQQMATFVRVVAVSFVVLLIVSSVLNHRILQPLLQCLDRRAAGVATAEDLRSGFAAASDVPRKNFLIGMAWWSYGGAQVGLAMALLRPDLPRLSAWIMLAAAVSGGLVSMIFHFFLLKRTLDEVRAGLAMDLGDPDAREACVRSVPLAWKLAVSMSAITGVPLFFALLLGQVQSQRAVEAVATGLELERLEQRLATGRVAQPADDPGLLWVDAGSGRVLAGPEGALHPGEIETLLSLDPERGDSSAFDSRHAFAWRRAPDGRVVVARVAPERIAVAGSWWVQGGFTALAIAVVALLVSTVARDVRLTTSALHREVMRLADGDLTPGPPCESEDELGALSRSFDRMAVRLRATVSQVIEAARGVEGAASDIAVISEDVNTATGDQVQGLQRVTVGMDRIRREATGITGSAQGLSTAVEESSSSMLQLGVTCEELSENAGTVTSRIDEVGGSIEQMIESSRRVTSGTESLAQASSETSSSMEEMASSLRQVNTNAAETSRLSSQVIEIAESGRRQVGETIQGMEAIRDATDSVQEVIHHLGERAGEIGSILGVIDDVADETNLLALNAAIIAAQAGEHGRAFSVVADEIKDLADKVISSTKEIGDLIRAVQGEVHNAIQAIASGTDRVQAGVELAAQAGVALENITSASRQSADRIGEIVAAVEEQSAAAAHVVGLMDKVREGSETIRLAGGEQARGNEVVLRSAGAMRDVAHQVQGATEEQTRGAHRMREAVENVRRAVEEINASLREQSSASEEIAEFLEQLYARTRSNDASAQRMRDAMRGLMGQAEGLRESVRYFQV